MKKKIIVITAVAALAVASIGSTLAYFSAETGTLSNVMIASGGFYDDDDLLIDLYEDFGYGTPVNYKGGDTVPSISNIVPTQVITKEPYIENEADLDAYVAIRFSLEATFDGMDPEDPLYDFNDFAVINWDGNLGDDGDWFVVWDDEDTMLSGVAYYKGVVSAIDVISNPDVIDRTEDLFKTVTINDLNDVPDSDEYLPDGTTLTINLAGYAVQVKDNANAIGATTLDKAIAAIEAEFDLSTHYPMP